MFEQLVESGSHKAEHWRRGKFIIITASVMAVLGFSFMIWGIMYATAQVDVQNLEMVTLVAPVSLPQSDIVKKAEIPKAQKVDISQNVDKRKELLADVSETKVIPKGVGIKASDIPPVRRGVVTMIDSENSNAVAPVAPNSGLGPGVQPRVDIGSEPPPPKLSPTPKPTPRPPISGGVMNGKATNLVTPQYPGIARSAHASGQVVVEVSIDESGNVTSAHAVSGHPLLQAAAVNAARASKFSPTLLSGQPVKVNGKIIYNFVPQ